MVHASGFLSGRHRKNFVPCRNRPPLKWSYLTSTTSLGSSGSHSPDRSVLHRLGPPGAFPLNPPPALAGFFSFSIFGVNSFRSFAEMVEQNPTWCSSPSSPYNPSSSEPRILVSFDPYRNPPTTHSTVRMFFTFTIPS